MRNTLYKKIPLYAMLIALAMILSYVEALIPIPFVVPGMKLGLANLVIVIALYLLSGRAALLISVLRVLLVGFLFGTGMSILYSLGGGIVSLLLMVLIKRMKGFSMIGVSIAGGVAHNMGQLAVAALVLQDTVVFSYAPALLIAGVVTGALIGWIAGRITDTVRKAFHRSENL